MRTRQATGRGAGYGEGSRPQGWGQTERRWAGWQMAWYSPGPFGSDQGAGPPLWVSRACPGLTGQAALAPREAAGWAGGPHLQ